MPPLASSAIMALLAAAVPPSVVPGGEHVMIDDNCVVTRFYGVPLNLKLADLAGLKFDHTLGFVSAEGDYYPAATLLVGKGVLLQAEFSADEDPVLYQLKTSSPGALGPGGVAVGASLKDVESKWPQGRLYWTSVHGPYVAFTNGTNVYFEFDPGDMPPNAFDLPTLPKQTATGKWETTSVKKVEPDPNKLKVTKIRISSNDIDYRCPDSVRKTN